MVYIVVQEEIVGIVKNTIPTRVMFVMHLFYVAMFPVTRLFECVNNCK